LADNNIWLCPNGLENQTYQVTGLANSSYTWNAFGGQVLSATNNRAIISWDKLAAERKLQVIENSAEGCRSLPVIELLKLDSLVTDPASGCLLSDVIIPNVITPNGDGKNDTWKITNLEFYPANSLKILNRYGVVLVNEAPYNNKWDANTLPAGTYYFLFETGRGKTYKGWIEVLK
jgi:gliding motility-associated-like protein